MKKTYLITKVVKIEGTEGPLGCKYRLYLEGVVGYAIRVEDNLMEVYPELRCENPDYQSLVGKEFTCLSFDI